MKITAADLERQYRGMSDAELLELDPAELSEAAQACLAKELARRNLTEGDVDGDEAESIDPATGDDAIEFATYVSRVAAETACSALKAAGLPAVLHGDAVYLPEELHREAHEVLEAMESLAPELVEQWLRTALPGRRIVIEDMITHDDIAAARLTIDGRHQAFCFVRFADRAIAENWHNFDQLPR